MGEGTNPVSVAAAPAAEFEREVQLVRENLTGIVKELDYRRQELLDWRGQLRRHRLALGMAATAIFLVIGGVVVAGVVRKRRRQRPIPMARRLSEALRWILVEPENVARPQLGIGNKALASAACGGAAILGKSLTQWFLPSRRQPRKMLASSQHGRIGVQ